MSEPIPESIPTSQDPRSKRPLKRRALTPLSERAQQLETLFKDPTKEIHLQAASKPRTTASLAPPPEVVANVQGSSAGAGSGEFHVYKASRRREYERVRLMEDQLNREQADEQFEKKMEEIKRKDDEKTEKNRKKREKRKAAKGKKGGIPPEKSEAEKKTEQVKGADGAGSHNTVLQVDEREQDGVEQEGTPIETPGVIIHDED